LELSTLVGVEEVQLTQQSLAVLAEMVEGVLVAVE
jgi:hypothetical protein